MPAQIRHTARLGLLLLWLLLAAGVVTATPQVVTIDGTKGVDEGYTAAATQDTPTGFGDNNDATTYLANGSELDAAWVAADDTTLYIFLAGNLETNYNKFELFIDTDPASGQNRLRGDNPDVDFNGLNRMGDDGSENGLTFDADFSADFYITASTGDSGGGNIQLCANSAQVLTDGGGVGTFEGCQAGQNDGPQPVNGASGIMIVINNSNTAGVDGASVNSPADVTTGIEIAIPFSVLGITRSQAGDLKATAFVNGGGHDFISNQVLAGIGGGSSLGEPRNVNFANVAGDQHFPLPLPAVPTAVTFAGSAVVGIGAPVMLLALVVLAALTLAAFVPVQGRRIGRVS